MMFGEFAPFLLAACSRVAQPLAFRHIHTLFVLSLLVSAQAHASNREVLAA